MAEQCPYCSGSIQETKETILKVSEEYDAKAVEQLNKMLEVFKNYLRFLRMIQWLNLMKYPKTWLVFQMTRKLTC